MAQHTSSQLFDSFRTSLQAELLDISYDLHNDSSSQDDLLRQVSEASRTLGELKRIGRMMLFDGSTHEITQVVPIAYFHQVVERDGQPPMTEFEWACLYTQDSLNMLTEHIMANRTAVEIARNFEAQSVLWEMRVRFPNVLSGAGHRPPPPRDALQIPSPAVVSSRSRIPQLVRDPPVDTFVYATYNPQRPVLTRANQYQGQPESGARITGLYRNPSIQPR